MIGKKGEDFFLNYITDLGKNSLAELVFKVFRYYKT